jgi:hypothetical protein
MWISASQKCYFPDKDLEQIKLDYNTTIDEQGLLWVRDKETNVLLEVFQHFKFGWGVK